MSTPSAAPVSGAAPSLSSPGWGAEFGALFKLGWPLIVAQVAQISLFTTDTLMLGWLGPKYLAAAALAISLFGALQLYGMGTVNTTAPMIAQALGAGDYRSIRRTVRQGVGVALLVAALLFVPLWNVAPIYRLLGQDPELIAMAETFIHFAIWLIFPGLLIIVFRSFLSAHGNTRAILFITVAGFFVNAAVDYTLIFGNFGFPRLELAGAGIATTVVNFVMLGCMIGYVQLHRRLRRYHVFHRFFSTDWPRFLEILRLGIPMGLMSLAEVMLFTSAALLQGWLGKDEIAAHAIALQFGSISFMVPLGLSQATTVRVGIALGERNPEGIRRAGWVSLGATLIFMSGAGALFLLFPHAFVSLFLDPNYPVSANAAALAASYLIVAGLFQLVDGTQVVMGAALRGLSDTTMPLIIALFGYWLVGIPVAYLLGFVAPYRGVGIWVGLAAGLAATAIILTARFAMRDRLGLTQHAPA